MSDIEGARIADYTSPDGGIMCARLVANALQAVLDAVRASCDEREYYIEIAQEAVDRVAKAETADDPDCGDDSFLRQALEHLDGR